MATNIQWQLRSNACFWLDFLWTPFCLSKNQRGCSFSTLCLKNKALPLPSTDSRWSTLMFKSKILPIVYVEDIPVKASMPNLVQLYQTLPTLPKDFAGEVVFDWIFWSLWIGNFHDSGFNYGYARICPKDHRGRVEMTLWSRALPPPRHFDSQIKGSSNSFRRRHSSEVTLSLYEHPRRPSTSEIQLYQKTLLEKLFLTWFFGVYE